MATKKTIKLPKVRRKYYQIYGMDGGLDYSKGSTFIGDTNTPSCREMMFRYSKASKMRGTNYFGGTDTTPLLDQIMHLDQYYKTTGTGVTIAHTITNVYSYNTSSALFENITRGVIVENCEDVWSVNANVTCAVDTDARKGTNSVKCTIAAAFTTGIAAYENFSSADLSGYTHLHFFIKSDIATSAGDLVIRLAETNAGAKDSNTWADYNVPALTAGVWKEVSVDLDSPDDDDGGTYPTDLDAVLSVALVVETDSGAQVVNIDDVMCTIETTGDEDDIFTSEIMNNYYVYSNNILPLMYWDMTSDTSLILYAGCTLASKVMRKFGERLCLYHTTENGTAKPQRVRWTIVGGLSTVPAATDWTDTGSGNTDLESTMGSDFIQNAQKLGNYVMIYGERTIVQQEYVGVVSDPFSFYTRVTGIGLAAPLAIANLGSEHIFLGWDNIYSYRGGREVLWVGDAIKKELFDIINPQYVHRSFMVYVEEDDEIRLHIPTGESTTPDVYFSYNITKKTWSRGVRSYTGFGYHTVASAITWASVGAGATAPWNDQTTRWNDITLQALAPLTLYGDSSGIVHNYDDSEYNLDGVAIDAWLETKDFVTGEGYRRTLTNWMQLQFEVRGHSVDISYSTDFGVSWSDAVTFSITSTTEWEMLNYDFEANGTQIRFKFRNTNVDETFELREIEVGYLEASDRGI